MSITDLQLITVTGKYLNLDGSPASGEVEFLASTVLVNQQANERIFPVTFTSTLVGGAFSISLPSTNDPDISPTGWFYTVTERIVGSNVPRLTYNIQLPYDLVGLTVDLADLAEVSRVDAMSSANVDGGTPSTVF